MASKSNQQVSDKHWYKASWQIGNGSLRAFLGVTSMVVLGETTRSERALQSLIQLSVRLSVIVLKMSLWGTTGHMEL